MSNEEMLKKKYEVLTPFLDERSLRLCMAADAIVLGYGGISCVAKAANASRTTIHHGISELVLERKPLIYINFKHNMWDIRLEDFVF
jgi:hypothetical protein